MKTTGNTIFFTGGTSGLGLGLARRFRDLGNTVIISGRRQDLLDRIAAEDGIEGVALDVADPDSIARAFEQVTSAHDVNVLVTMAGIMQVEDLRDPVTSRPRSRRSTSTCSARSAPSPRSRRTC